MNTKKFMWTVIAVVAFITMFVFGWDLGMYVVLQDQFEFMKVVMDSITVLLVTGFIGVVSVVIYIYKKTFESEENEEA